MAKGYCPECDEPIRLGDRPSKGQKVTCPACGAYLEVVALSPIELDWAIDEDEDFDYEDDFEDELEDYEYDDSRL